MYSLYATSQSYLFTLVFAGLLRDGTGRGMGRARRVPVRFRCGDQIMAFLRITKDGFPFSPREAGGKLNARHCLAAQVPIQSNDGSWPTPHAAGSRTRCAQVMLMYTYVHCNRDRTLYGRVGPIPHREVTVQQPQLSKSTPAQLLGKKSRYK